MSPCEAPGALPACRLGRVGRAEAEEATEGLFCFLLLSSNYCDSSSNDYRYRFPPHYYYLLI